MKIKKAKAGGGSVVDLTKFSIPHFYSLKKGKVSFPVKSGRSQMVRKKREKPPTAITIKCQRIVFSWASPYRFGTSCRQRCRSLLTDLVAFHLADRQGLPISHTVKVASALIHICFKRKLLIHIENRVDPGRYKPGWLTQFKLTNFFDWNCSTG